MPKLEDLPWDSDVSGSDPCQPIRKRKMGGVVVLCDGVCTGGKTCTLQKRRAGSEQDWEIVSGGEEAGDSDYEYRCACK